MEFTRRHTLAAAGASMLTAATPAFAGWEPSERYPDPAIKPLDSSFEKYRIALAGVERIAGGCRFNEGAVYFGDARCLLWSDIPNNRIMRWDEETGRVSVFRKPSNHANGNTRDRQGRLITCEHSGRRITRTDARRRIGEPDGIVGLDHHVVGGQVRRFHLVHRSAVGHRRQLPGRG